jgi:hypothetical protein
MFLLLVYGHTTTVADAQFHPIDIEVGATLLRPMEAPFKAIAGNTDPYITPYFHADYQRPGVAGGYSIGVVLANHLAITVDGIYISAHLSTAIISRDLQGNLFSFSAGYHARAWEWPLTASYRLGHSRIQPYGGGGITLTDRARLEDVDTLKGSGSTVSHGAGGGRLLLGGIAANVLHCEFTSEVRYIRWTGSNYGGLDYTLLARKHDEIMVGLGIKGRVKVFR